jgi:hypothetical protein
MVVDEARNMLVSVTQQFYPNALYKEQSTERFRWDLTQHNNHEWNKSKRNELAAAQSIGSSPCSASVVGTTANIAIVGSPVAAADSVALIGTVDRISKATKNKLGEGVRAFRRSTSGATSCQDGARGRNNVSTS